MAEREGGMPQEESARLLDGTLFQHEKTHKYVLS